MKRPWLTASLLAVIAGMSAIGINHAATVALDRGISRFRAALPAGATLTYASARPAILARGALLTDVVLQNGNLTFRAHTMRLGHPIPTPDGGLILSHLDMEDPTFQTPNSIIRAHSVHMTHLVTPPPTAGKSGLEALDFGHITLDRGTVDHLSVQNLSQVLQPNGTHFNSLTSDSIQIEGYGPDQTATVTIQNVMGIVSRTTLQADRTSRMISLQMSLRDFKIKQPEFSAWVAAQQTGNTALSYAIPPVESLKLSNAQIISSDRSFRLDTLTGKGTRKNGRDNSTFEGQGFHFHSTQAKTPVHIDGLHSTLTYTQERVAETGAVHAQALLAVPDLTELHFTMDLTGPSDQQLKLSSSQPLQDAVRLVQTTLTIHGDRLIQLLPSFNAGRPLNGTEQDQARTVMAQGLEMALSPYPSLAALPNYVANPDNRTLSIVFAPKPPMALTALSTLASTPVGALSLLSPEALTVTAQ
ncbi:hypothetical protein QMA67_06075 [Gluconobacter japonicus]|uniref:hypothetical protein n=1 Tax=Gluconobacter japonicus TaxID=376620 RepID=UPI0024ACCE6A|nr:hypothetical protein [Gluconobacter japonicus]MDI6652507.1 hypothetical protein [Gluconobacter japonicus]